jgi:O-acetyl-ADP-ribose deacetylase (regulator of RNase III)
MKIIKGNLITLALAGEFDVISHGCNCFCTMGAGIAPQMAKAFGADTFKMEHESWRGDYNKLGQIDFELVNVENKPDMIVVNSYTQYGFGRNHEGGTKTPLDYVALEMCMQKINHMFKGSRVGLPWIGCGLAGGDKNRVKEILERTLTDVDLTIVELN